MHNQEMERCWGLVPSRTYTSQPGGRSCWEHNLSPSPFGEESRVSSDCEHSVPMSILCRWARALKMFNGHSEWEPVYLQLSRWLVFRSLSSPGLSHPEIVSPPPGQCTRLSSVESSQRFRGIDSFRKHRGPARHFDTCRTFPHRRNEKDSKNLVT